jgi:glycosyltransferase involved in cell wall biosynthesis
VLLPVLASQGIDVAVVDNESTDGSQEIYSAFAGRPIITVQTLSYRGVFALAEQLAAKRDLSKRIDHDWIIHHDADEIMDHEKAGRTLRDAIQEADEAGYNALNFDEFAFLPEPGADYRHGNYYTEMLRYYFFKPVENRLNRVWKRTLLLDNVSSGGHHLRGSGLLIAPTNHVLRHYIVLSYEHALQKYLDRSFDSVDLDLGWHVNRRSFTARNLTLPRESEFLFRLSSCDSKNFVRGRPASRHFWEWEERD